MEGDYNQYLYFGGKGRPFIVDAKTLKGFWLGDDRFFNDIHPSKNIFVIETQVKARTLVISAGKDDVLLGPVPLDHAYISFPKSKVWPGVINIMRITLPRLSKINKLAFLGANSLEVEKCYNYLVCKHVSAFLASTFPTANIVVEMAPGHINSCIAVECDGRVGIYSPKDFAGPVFPRIVGQQISSFWEDNHSIWFAGAHNTHRIKRKHSEFNESLENLAFTD